MKTLQDQWALYRDTVYPNGLPADQNRECRQAFFSGAFVGLVLVQEAAAKELSAEESFQLIESVICEAQSACQGFIDKVMDRERIANAVEKHATAQNPKPETQ